MRNYDAEIKNRVEFIRDIMKKAGADGIVFGCSGGKDSALVGILCKKACDNTIAVVMPCSSKQNYETDMQDALSLSDMFKIETRKVDLTKTAQEIVKSLSDETELTQNARNNISPRLRMTALYAIAASENRLVAGTGNRSEGYMGYFTKWGDGAFDFNPIADLTVTEIYEFLTVLKAPESIITKAPSAGLFDGQTDEAEMGITYKAIDDFLLKNDCNEEELKTIEKYHRISEHKRALPAVYGDN